ncbi:hypothetical protein DOQ73_25125, partial [Salmonella enterica subsp. enterica]|nr:hypothetical protein [Salmonella enterica subsp. enterica serovar Javiana]
DMGCSGHIARVIRMGDLNPMAARFAVRCLGQLGDAPGLGDVARDSAVPAAVRLHAVKTLAELGWVQEAAEQARGIAHELDESAERTV